MWANASIFRIGPFWPPRGPRALVDDNGRAPPRDEAAVIDEALARGNKLGDGGECTAPKRRRPAVADDRLRRGCERVSHRALSIDHPASVAAAPEGYGEASPR